MTYLHIQVYIYIHRKVYTSVYIHVYVYVCSYVRWCFFLVPGGCPNRLGLESLSALVLDIFHIILRYFVGKTSFVKKINGNLKKETTKPFE